MERGKSTESVSRSGFYASFATVFTEGEQGHISANIVELEAASDGKKEIV
eukprot:m.296815 g.296815  ORF g.296815 m.296815 type:complete len:50 (+) comp16393_c8_seq6:1177-1326(+)